MSGAWFWWHGCLQESQQEDIRSRPWELEFKLIQHLLLLLCYNTHTPPPTLYKKEKRKKKKEVQSKPTQISRDYFIRFITRHYNFNRRQTVYTIHSIQIKVRAFDWLPCEGHGPLCRPCQRWTRSLEPRAPKSLRISMRWAWQRYPRAGDSSSEWIRSTRGSDQWDWQSGRASRAWIWTSNAPEVYINNVNLHV